MIEQLKQWLLGMLAPRQSLKDAQFEQTDVPLVTYESLTVDVSKVKSIGADGVVGLRMLIADVDPTISNYYYEYMLGMYPTQDNFIEVDGRGNISLNGVETEYTARFDDRPPPQLYIYVDVDKRGAAPTKKGKVFVVRRDEHLVLKVNVRSTSEITQLIGLNLLDSSKVLTSDSATKINLLY